MKTISETHVVTQTQNNVNLLAAASLIIGALVTGQCQAGAMKADFNGDGIEDMAIGVPNESIAGLNRAGAVKVVYGRADGTWRAHSDTDYFHQTKYQEEGTNLQGLMEAYDQFGASIAVGDFNDDGYDDLAVGSPNESLGNNEYQVGLVNIAYGSASGLRHYRNHQLNMKRFQNGAYLRNYNHFGAELSVGDYDGDGVDDLAVGYTDKINATSSGVGGVIVFFGKAGYSGLLNAETSPKTYITRGSLNRNTLYGSELATGDFNSDGFDDLAIGAYKDTITSNIKSGTITLVFGTEDWIQNRPRKHKMIPDVRYRQQDAQFGYALTTGNFDLDSQDELAIGMPGYDSAGKKGSGAVVMVNFKSNGDMTQRYLYQSLGQIPGSSQKAEHFGDSLVAADFDNDGYDDLAIGIPYKTKNSFWSWKTILGHGAVAVLYGNRYDFNFQRSQIWHQDTSGIEGGREDGDNFGDSLSSGDFNSDGVADLLVGASNEAIGSIKYAGSVQFIWGHSSGLTAQIAGKHLFHQGSFNAAGFGSNENERLDQFGMVLVP